MDKEYKTGLSLGLGIISLTLGMLVLFSSSFLWIHGNAVFITISAILMGILSFYLSEKDKLSIGLSIGAIGIATIGFSIAVYQLYEIHKLENSIKNNTNDYSNTQSQKIEKDLTVKQQIIQQDYKMKVKQMLDSGLSVHEISKETGLRVDEIRKIKKENH